MKEVIAVTGSMASGKSYAMEIFECMCKKNGIKALFLSVDDIRRNILMEHHVNIHALNSRIYYDESLMKEYKDRLNPVIKDYLKEQIKNFDGIIFFEWALLLEEDYSFLADKILMINCSEEKQLKRLFCMFGDYEESKRRLHMQYSNQEKIKKIKMLKKPYYIFDTTSDPSINEYQKMLKEMIIL